MIDLIKSGQITKPALRAQLAVYIKERTKLLLDNSGDKSKLQDIDMSITFLELFVDNFNKIKGSK